jgi:hypothetical protein
MIDYSVLWQKGNEIFYDWEVTTGKAFSDDDRQLFVQGFIQGYLFLNQVEVAYD